MMGVRSQVNQERRVSIEPRNMYSCGHQIKRIAQALCGKPTACSCPEGSRLQSEVSTASIGVTTGV